MKPRSNPSDTRNGRNFAQLHRGCKTVYTPYTVKLAPQSVARTGSATLPANFPSLHHPLARAFEENLEHAGIPLDIALMPCEHRSVIDSYSPVFLSILVALIQRPCTRFAKPALLLGGLGILLVLPAGVARAGCRHRGFTANELLRLVGEQSRVADRAPSRSELDGSATPASPTFVIPLPCDSSAPRVQSVVSCGLSAIPVPSPSGPVPRGTWALPQPAHCHPVHASQADVPPPRA